MIYDWSTYIDFYVQASVLPIRWNHSTAFFLLKQNVLKFSWNTFRWSRWDISQKVFYVTGRVFSWHHFSPWQWIKSTDPIRL